jgi:hypothetical protein
MTGLGGLLQSREICRVGAGSGAARGNMPQADLLIIGAGPFGLSLAAHAHGLGLETAVVGKPMGFWKDHMPQGMYLRSACDWHLDADERHTIAAFLADRGQALSDVEPLSRDLYVEYADWFRRQAGIEPLSRSVSSLERRQGGFTAVMDDGTALAARNVAVAIGFSNFPQVPPELLPAGTLVAHLRLRRLGDAGEQTCADRWRTSKRVRVGSDPDRRGCSASACVAPP